MSSQGFRRQLPIASPHENRPTYTRIAQNIAKKEAANWAAQAAVKEAERQRLSNEWEKKEAERQILSKEWEEKEKKRKANYDEWERMHAPPSTNINMRTRGGGKRTSSKTRKYKTRKYKTRKYTRNY